VAIKQGIGTQGGESVNLQKDVNVVRTELFRIFENLTEQSVPVMKEVAEMIKETAVEFAPLDTGALRESGRTRVLKRGGKAGGGEVSVDISFGGEFNTVSPTDNAPHGVVDYAVTVHEDMEHTYKVGGPKYLENAVKHHTPGLSQLIASKLRIKK
jgi:hypothetical protein